MKKGSKKRLITAKEKDLKKFSGRLIEQIKKKGYNIENDCHVINNMIQDMEKTIAMPDNSYKTIKSHVFGGNCDIQWLKRYCEYFHCPADYLLGFMEKDLADIHTQTGLSDKAIRKLVTNKEYRFMTNALLERKGVEYLVQAVEFDCYHKAQHKRISDFMYKSNGKGTVLEKNVNLPGVTLSDLEIYHSNVKGGYQGQREALAIVYLDEIERDRKIYKYFKEKAEEKIKQQVEEEAAADQGKSTP